MSKQTTKIVEFLIYMFEIKGKNTVDAYVNEIVAKLEKYHIKHEVKILSKSNDNDDVYATTNQSGGSGSAGELTYPYKLFSEFGDKIKGLLRKSEQEQENKEERKTFFESLFMKKTETIDEAKEDTPEDKLSSDEELPENADNNLANDVEYKSSSIDTKNIGEDSGRTATDSLEYKKYYDAFKSGVVEIRILLEDTRHSYKEILIGKQELDNYIQELTQSVDLEPTTETPVEKEATEHPVEQMEPIVEDHVEPIVEQMEPIVEQKESIVEQPEPIVEDHVESIVEQKESIVEHPVEQMESDVKPIVEHP